MTYDTFFCSDHHFGHKAIIRFTDSEGYKIRPFDTIKEHNEYIVQKHNSVVGKNDKCFFLGDVSFGKNGLEYLSRMNGYKYLLLGNHDRYSTSEYLKYFNKVFGQIDFDHDFILTHIPVHNTQLDHRYKFCIHGHLHTHRVKLPDGVSDDPRYICVSMEQINYTPISFEEIQEKLKNIF